jgi:hypothetical protein
MEKRVSLNCWSVTVWGRATVTYFAPSLESHKFFSSFLGILQHHLGFRRSSLFTAILLIVGVREFLSRKFCQTWFSFAYYCALSSLFRLGFSSVQENPIPSLTCTLTGLVCIDGGS